MITIDTKESGDAAYFVECHLCKRLVNGLIATKFFVCGQVLHEGKLCNTIEIRFYCDNCVEPDTERYII